MRPLARRAPGHRFLPPLTAALLLAGCAAATTPGLPSARPSGATAATPGPSTPEGQPATVFTFGSDEPVVSREQTGVEAAYINPGAVFEHEGRLHMFANLFTAFPGQSRIVYLASDDGVAWDVAADGPVFSSDRVPFAGTGAHVSAGFVTDDGTWVLIFETLTSLEPWRLGRATAPAAEGPWAVDPEPILEPGPEGAMDAGGLSWPSVVPTEHGYAMYYTAAPQPRGDGVIAMATSPDGDTWTKREEPVLVPEADWEDGSVDRPRVALTPSGLVMVYAGRDLTQRGVAFSDDGVAWERDGTQPAITAHDFPVRGRAWDAALLYRDGALHYLLEIGTASSAVGTELYLATAPLDAAGG